MNFYSVGKVPVAIFLKLFFRLEVIGRENISAVPKERGILLCSNHVSNLDPPAVGVASQRELSFMAKSELFKIPLFKQLISSLNAFPVKRGTGDRQAIKLAINLLNSGGTLIMFPEGHRSKNGLIGKGQAGVGFLAMKTDAAIVPIAIVGHYRLFRKTKVIIGKAIDFDQLKTTRGKAAEATEIIMDHIRKLAQKHQ